MTWQSKLTWLVKNASGYDYPIGCLYLCDLNPPVNRSWTNGLPSHPVIREYFSICDGGMFGPVWNFFSLEQIANENAHYHDLINSGHRRVVDISRDLVIAAQSDGTPIVVNTTTGRVGAYYWRDIYKDDQDGWTDFSFETPSAFFEWLFDPRAQNDEWRETLLFIQRALGNPSSGREGGPPLTTRSS